MAVMKEYFCPGHGDFDSTSPVCPRGCTIGVERHFRTAPGLAFGVAKKTDKLLEGVAKSYGLSDMDNRGGRPARMLGQGDKMRAMRESIEKKFGKTGWGQVAPGGVYEVGVGVRDGEKGGGAVATMQQFGSPPAQSVSEVLQDVPKPPVQRIVDRRDPGAAAVIKAAA